LLVDAGPDRERARARIGLARAECAMLMGRMDEARSLCAEAGERFGEWGDTTGTGDATFLRARIAEAQGDREGELAGHREARAAYESAGDPERLAHARAAAMLSRDFGDPEAMAREITSLRAEAAGLSRAVDVHL